MTAVSEPPIKMGHIPHLPQLLEEMQRRLDDEETRLTRYLDGSADKELKTVVPPQSGYNISSLRLFTDNANTSYMLFHHQEKQTTGEFFY